MTVVFAKPMPFCGQWFEFKGLIPLKGRKNRRRGADPIVPYFAWRIGRLHIEAVHPYFAGGDFQ
jgi:hypothetical protein